MATAILSQLKEIWSSVSKDYAQSSTVRKRLVDGLCVYSALTAAVQLLYCVFVGSFPFNSFLSGFICHVGLFALGVSLRLQLSDEFKWVSGERAFAEFAFCALVLFFMVFSFMG
jgi:oligosaccharyltransferase complex subunit epsilon